MLDYNHPHELVPREWKPGRLRVYLRNNSKKKYSFSVSHLVWMAFNNKLHIPEKMVIDHINCNTLDNRPENLQCITYSENIKRAYTCTRTAFTSNGINGTNKFNTLTISKVLEDYQNGHTQAEICERYNIPQKQVSGIVNGQRRKDIYLTKLVSMEYEGEKTIYDLSVNDKHSYITRSNFINSNTVSGRLSSRNPNGQNIPKTMVNPDVKLQFIPPKNQLFLSYDYSQAELRILAHLANESTMLEWFRTGKDIHLASACKKYHEDYNPKYWDEKQLRYFFTKYSDLLLGVKIRISKPILGDYGFRIFEKAVEFASKLNTRLCVHTTDPVGGMAKVAKLLRKGDILAHCFHGTGSSIIGENGKVLPEIIEAQKRGVIMDAANGSNHWSFITTDAAIKSGFYPDVISTDLSCKTLYKDPVFSLPYIMSKYLMLGMPLTKIIKAVTITPASLMNSNNGLGTLSVGAEGNVSVFALDNIDIVFSDTQKRTRMGHQVLVPQLTVCQGKIVYRNITFQ